MDLKAFNKLYSEAVEAISEKRFYDALELTRALSKDLQGAYDSELLDSIKNSYNAFIENYIETGDTETLTTTISKCYYNLIRLLETIRSFWHAVYQPTFYGQVASKQCELGWKDFLEQIQRTRRSKLGNTTYHEALDTAFDLAWTCSFGMDNVEEEIPKICRTDYFVRKTLVGGLMMGVLDSFSPLKIQLLLTLGAEADKDMNKAELMEKDEASELQNDASDLRARVASALTIIYQRYQHYFPFFPSLQDGYSRFLSSQYIQPELSQLLNAFVCQSLTPHAGQRMDNILKVVKDLFQQQQPHLGSNDSVDITPSEQDAESKPETGKVEEEKMGFRMEVVHIDMNQNGKFLDKMADYARVMDILRQNNMDINYSSNKHLKHFTFFQRPAHWFYPFNALIPDIKNGINLSEGAPDALTLMIMNQNRFCDSDRYSYLCMLSFLHSNGKKSITDQLQDQLQDQFQDMKEEEAESFGKMDSADMKLNPYTNFCQCCYRFFHSTKSKNEYNDLLSNDSTTLLPLLPPFQPHFQELTSISRTVETYLFMGDGEHPVELLNYFLEHQDSTAEALRLRGRSYMQAQHWRNAISDFQQSMLIEEDSETRLYVIRCYEALKEWDRALPLLLQQEKEIEQEDADLIEEIARCLIEMKRWDDALQRFFQLELMDKHLGVCRRGIGWCSLHQGRFERAEQYYNKVIENTKKPSWEDYINFGHAHLLLGRRPEAVAAYKQSSLIFNKAKKVQRHYFKYWTEAFHEDARDLLQKRFTQLELAAILDAVNMK
ncbi:MAG: hypothetical protein K6C30_02385 [Bacteroidaceae bacterium]|nr:hypothetical protein [Bacteroidaceae bacterium]